MVTYNGQQPHPTRHLRNKGHNTPMAIRNISEVLEISRYIRCDPQQDGMAMKESHS